MNGYVTSDQIDSLWAVYLAFAAVGVVVTFLAARAFLARHTASLALLAGGLGLVTVGTPATWMGAYALSGNMYICALTSTVAAVVGAAVLIASVYVRDG